ncbi:MAG: adenylate/guanylate cyclase domain-containing protein [Thermodesulfobacteriota bacterium]|nr:adenylate/guanylate cyclase domain-containing protein [Thermodesulfobacteriota bacterium]
MECPKCQQQNPDDAKFCNKCGSNLVECLDMSGDSGVVDSERKLVTVLFSDMTGYTAMTERLDPEEVKGIMSQIFGLITEVIKNYDGFIERFIGDAVMAVFGVPKAHEDDPIRAIRAALDIHSAVEDFSPRFEDKIGRSLTMHTGINTGIVVTGEVDIEKGTHGLTGDAINLASRIEGLAKPGEILLGESTYQQAQGYFKFKNMEPAQVKGKTEPVQAYKVVSVLDQETVIRHLNGVQAELIGRETEMNQLLGSLENLKNGKGSVISIVGHAGTGKSRLIREFKTCLELEEVQWREGHAYAYTQNIAYYPLSNLLTHAFRIREGDDTDEIGEKVNAGVKELLWDKPEAKKYLGGLFSLSNANMDEMSPELWRKQLKESAHQLLEALASRAPTVIVFEDLHWADGAFIELLHFLLKNTHRPVLFICIYRPSFTLFSKEEYNSLAWPHHKIEIHDLTWDQTQSMLHSLLDSQTLPDELRYFIKQKVEGNPFYLEEVVNTLIETGILKSKIGGWIFNQSFNLASVPPTIQGVLTARVDRLEKELKRVLQEAAVIGRAFYYEVLARVTELSTNVDDCLLSLEKLDLIRARSREPDLEYIFKHALTQEVVYNGLLKEERLEIHARIGSVIEKLFENRLTDFYETLAFHFYRGKRIPKALEYLTKAGKKSLKRYAVEEAHQHYRMAFDLLSKMHNRSTADNELLIGILVDWALVFYYRGDFRKLSELLISYEKVANSLPDSKDKGMYYAWVGFALDNRFEPKKSYQYLQKALYMGEKIKSDSVIGYACTWLTWSCSSLAFFEEAIEHGNRAQKIAHHLESDTYIYFKSLAGMGVAYFFKGESENAIKIGQQLLKYGDDHANIRCQAIGYYIMGYGHCAGGNFAKAIEISEKSIQCAIDPFYTVIPNLVAGFCHMLNNHYEEAKKHFNKIISFNKKRGIELLGIPAQACLSAISVAEGQMHIGFNKLRNIQKICIKKEYRNLGVMIEHIIGKIYYEMIAGPKPSIGKLIRNIGFLVKNYPFAAGKAEAHFKKVIEFAKVMGAKGTLAQAYLDLGLLHKKKNQTDLAKKCLSESIHIFEKCGSEAYAKQAKEELASLS